MGRPTTDEGLPMRRAAIVLVLSLTCLAATAASRDWRTVPGTEDIEVEIGSVQQQGSTVTAWVRSLAVSGALDRLVREQGRDLPKHRHTAVLAQADCRARNVKPMALVAYGPTGAPVWSTGVPGKGVAPEGGEAIAWLYDSLCEMGRATAIN
jgi:hypothetical protein